MKLPILKGITIEHLSLSRDTIRKQFEPGINMIIGGNGIGKTTLINTVLYALVGNSPYEWLNLRTGRTEATPLIEKNYFRGRLSPDDLDRARVTLTFMVDGAEFTIARALGHPRILCVSIQNEADERPQLIDGDPDSLEMTYRKLMEQALDVTKFEDFVFLVAHLLLFDEQRKTLTWDSEAQNRILRLLFLDEFDNNFNALSNQVTDLNTKARHRSEARKEIRRSIARWTESKAEATAGAAAPQELDRERIEAQIAHLETELDRREDELSALDAMLEDSVTQIKSWIAEANQVEIRKIPLAEEIERLETQFYSEIYRGIPPEYQLVLEGLHRQGVCQVCGTRGEGLRALGATLKTEGLCLVCRSPVEYRMEAEESNDHSTLVRTINDLRKQQDQLSATQQACEKAQTAANLELKSIQDKVAEAQRSRRAIESTLAELRSRLTLDSASQPSADSKGDDWLDTQKQEIARLDQEILEYYSQSEQALKQLEKLNEMLVSRLGEVRDNLTPLFADYASRFLGTHCELVISQRTHAKKPVAYMFPRFYDTQV